MTSAILAGIWLACALSSEGASGRLHLDTYTAGQRSFGVTSTLIYGEHEAILVDGQYNLTDAARLADRIAGHGRRLKAIVITHPDEDHYIGTAVLHERFPDTPIYMTAAALENFKETSGASLAGKKKYDPAETPESVPTPTVLPAMKMLVDGEPVEIVPDLQGDVLAPTNSIVWIPSLRAVIAGDVVFNGIHVWLAHSSPESRVRWRASLDRIAAYHPAIVVPGHKRTPEMADSPSAVEGMRKYLTAFDAARARAHDADELIAAMKREFPDWTVDYLLERSAKSAFLPPVVTKEKG